MLALLRGYPPVLGAMLLVDGVLTLILGGDATVSLGEVVAYLLLPPLAMFLLTQLTGGRGLNAVAIGAGAAGAVIIFAALFLGGGVHLLTLPGWVLALMGLVLLGAAVFLMRQSAPTTGNRSVPEADNRATPSWDDYGPSADENPEAESRDDYASPEYGARSPEYGAPAHDYGTSSRDDPGAPSHDYGAPARDTAAGLPSHAAGPAESDWPPRRAPVNAPGWSDGPADREWPPAPSAHEWPPRRDPEPTPEAQRSWFEADDQQPAEQTWTPDSDREWPPTSGGRRSDR